MNHIKAMVAAVVIIGASIVGAGGEVHAGLSGCSSTRNNNVVSSICNFNSPGGSQRQRAWGQCWTISGVKTVYGPWVYVLQKSTATCPTSLLTWGYQLS